MVMSKTTLCRFLPCRQLFFGKKEIQLFKQLPGSFFYLHQEIPSPHLDFIKRK